MAPLQGVISPAAYWTFVSTGGLTVAVLCLLARRFPGVWANVVARVIGTVLFADVVAYSVDLGLKETWSPKTSLPLALCNAGVLVAALACWWKVRVLVELTYFLGLAGTLQAVITPDLSSAFPHPEFFEYIAGHVGVVGAALFLVVGMRIEPARGAVKRVLAITAVYTAFVGLVDYLTGANYMFLRREPSDWTLLRLLGPWPWYVVSAVAVAFVLFVALDTPFRSSRARSSPPARL